MLLVLLPAAIGLGAGSVARGNVPDALEVIPPGKSLMFIGQAVEPAVVRSMEDYVTGMNRVPAGFTFYLILSGDVERTRVELQTMRAFMDRYPGTALQLALGYGSELTGNLKESMLLLAGRFDPELQSVADWLKSLEHPVLLRPLYEFDRACGTSDPDRSTNLPIGTSSIGCAPRA